MALYVFDITAAEVATVVAHSGTIDASAEPPSTQLTAWITGRAAQATVSLKGLGLDASDVLATGDTEALYHACRLQISQRVAADWIRWNQRRDSDFTREIKAEFDAWRAELKDIPDHRVGETAHAGGVREGFTDTVAAEVETRGIWVKGEMFR